VPRPTKYGLTAVEGLMNATSGREGLVVLKGRMHKVLKPPATDTAGCVVQSLTGRQVVCLGTLPAAGRRSVEVRSARLRTRAMSA